MLTIARCYKTILLLILCGTAAFGHAECSDSKVKRLQTKGETVRAIAKTCEMSKADVKEILDEAEDKSDRVDMDGDAGKGGDDKLPSGAPLSECGCWGAVSTEARKRAPQCKSGIGRPQICQGFCTPGGSPWRDSCA